MNIKIMIKSNLNLSKKYKTRYLNPLTKEILEKSRYLKNGKKQAGRLQFLIGDEWVTQDNVPEYREYIKERYSCFEGFLPKIKKRMVEGDTKFAKKSLIGENEFDDKRDCYDKIIVHYKEQVERYGPRCPITDLEFTFDRLNKKVGKGNGTRSTSNISPDRLLNNIRYTKKNVLFTTTGWNLLRGDFSLEDMAIYIPKPFFENYVKILLERFPDQIYKINELENGAEHPQERR